MKIIKNVLFISVFALATMSFTQAIEKERSWDYCDGYADAMTAAFGLSDYGNAMTFEDCMGW